MPVDDFQVVLNSLVPLRPGRVILENCNIAGQTVFEETLLREDICDIEIVVEVDKMLCQTGDFMQIAFNNHRIIGRQELLRNIVPVIHQMNLRMAFIQPCRFLPAGDKMDFAHPRHKLLHATEPVFQETVIAEAGFGNPVLRVLLVTGVLRKVCLPLRVVHVDPCNYKIYIHTKNKHFLLLTTTNPPPG